MESSCSIKYRGRLGPDPEDNKSIRVLNRIVEWKPWGIQYEPDQRHAEVIVAQLGLESNSKTVTTPWTDRIGEAGIKAKGELPPALATRYRAITARGLYLRQDREDIQYAVKELSRHM